jgi:hypothetical protein
LNLHLVDRKYRTFSGKQRTFRPLAINDMTDLEVRALVNLKREVEKACVELTKHKRNDLALKYRGVTYKK